MPCCFLKEGDDTEPFVVWLKSLRDQEARKRVLARFTVVERGSLGAMRPVGEGVRELKVDYGPGYRIYFARKGTLIIVIIVGGDKDGQQTDIVRAKELWKRCKDDVKDA